MLEKEIVLFAYHEQIEIWAERISKFIIFGLLLICVFLSGRAYARGIERAKSIKAEAGRWTINTKTGVRAFEYGVKGEINEHNK